MLEWVNQSFDNRQDRDKAAAGWLAEGYEVETFGMGVPGRIGGVSSFNLSASRERAEEFAQYGYGHGYTN